MSHQERFTKLLERIPADVRERHLAEAKILHMPGNVPPWTDTGIQLGAGESVTMLSTGKVILSAELDMWASPTFYLWGRIGDGGRVFRGTRSTHTLTASEPGPLHLAVYHGEWKTPSGELATPVEAYATNTGGFDVLLLRWKGAAADGLGALAAALPDEPLLASEKARLEGPVLPPLGWKYLWFLGDGEIFRAAHEGGARLIHVHTADDVGILQTKVDVPIGPNTTVSWRWRVSELASKVEEDSPLTHDYVSLALEFENGRDLTWYWSAKLPVGTYYDCPLPTWNPRETHWVIRSGPAGIGEWQSESRTIRPDVQRAMGFSPSRIVSVWLIAVSLFRHGRGVADFADVVIGDDENEVRVI